MVFKNEGTEQMRRKKRERKRERGKGGGGVVERSEPNCGVGGVT